MNYLAHCYLAPAEDESLLGNLMGDFVRGPIAWDYSPEISQGIWLHRKIDAFTDSHRIVRRSKQRISLRFRRYAAILVDLFYDHFLAKHWELYSAVSLRDFCTRVYCILQAHYQDLPPTMKRSVSYMIANDLLMSYQEIAGIRRSLCGIEGRLKRPSRLSEAMEDLESNYDSLSLDFAAFFPELRVQTSTFLKIQSEALLQHGGRILGR